MKYLLYIDESGDHGLSNLNPDFPVFVLCGVLATQDDYEAIRLDFNQIKSEFWGNKKVIFHSRDIRKCEKEFAIFFNLELKARFYHQLNQVIAKSNYTIISSVIQKEKYIKEYGRLSTDVYELSLSFIIERTIFLLDEVANGETTLEIVIEKRGKKEDKNLQEHFQRVLSRGTGYVNPDRLRQYNVSINFKSKIENINGLQFADLLAYPIARYVIEPDRANPAFEIIEPKFYQKSGKRYGLKVFP
ncbi:MAG: DUF3800 domain-containing protein [Bacteroidota bacterium]